MRDKPKKKKKMVNEQINNNYKKKKKREKNKSRGKKKRHFLYPQCPTASNQGKTIFSVFFFTQPFKWQLEPPRKFLVRKWIQMYLQHQHWVQYVPSHHQILDAWHMILGCNKLWTLQIFLKYTFLLMWFFTAWWLSHLKFRYCKVYSVDKQK